jgi:hypothetical protein
MATKKIGVEMSAARAEIIPHANIAARTSDSAAMSRGSFHTFSPVVASYPACSMSSASSPAPFGVLERRQTSNDAGRGTGAATARLR